MTKIFLLVAILFAACVAYAQDFTVKSAAWPDGGIMAETYVFNGFGCSGENVSPDIEWSNPPEGTKSFAVTVYDPDAPTGSGWWHWTVFNIPADTRALKAGAGSTEPSVLPAGAVQGRTDFAKPGYGGACPPQSDKPHHYILTVFALKTDKIDLDDTAPGAMVGYYLNQNALAKASLTVTYGR